MDQKYMNINVANALSAMNKAIMSLQEKVIVLASRTPETAYLADLARMDLELLKELQAGLNRLKMLV